MKTSNTDKNPYDVLGVPPNASAAAIKKAYRREVRKYHPDKHEGNELAGLAKERLAAINWAYDILGDTKKRREYDTHNLASGGYSSHRGGAGAGPPRFLRPVFYLLGIAGLGILMRYLQNPRVWLVVAVGAGLVWAIGKANTKKDD